MKKIRKALAVLLTMAMMMGLGITAFADVVVIGTEGKAPSASDQGTITVNGVDSGATVIAYKIVEAVYAKDGGGFTGYQAVDGYTIKDVTAPTSTEIAAIAKTLNNNSYEEDDATTVKMTETSGTPVQYTASVTAGSWIVLVTTANSATIYNPMLVSLWYSKSGTDGTMSSEAVSANDSWTLNSDNAWKKSDSVDVDKTITNPTVDDTNNGTDAAFGDTISYQVATSIPDYSAEYTQITYEISDTLSSGLDWVTQDSGKDVKFSNLKVTVNDTALTISDETNGTGNLTSNEKKVGEVTIDYDAGTLLVQLTNLDFILANAGKAVVLTYDAVLNEEAGTNFDYNDNKVELKYSNDPQDKNSTVTKTDKTYTYTFEIDGSLFGRYEGGIQGQWDEVTYELIKVDENTTEKVKVDEETHYLPYQSDGTTTTALKGAKFELKNNSNGKTYPATTGDDGYMNFAGLDAGKYTLKEVEAPEGYTLNDATYTVEISAAYNEDGTLKTYTIKVTDSNDNSITNTYTADYKDMKEVTLTVDNGDSTDPTVTIVKLPTVTHTKDGSSEGATLIKNTKLAELPSTGGIGTTIFTIGGCIIMIAAAGLFFASRKRAAK